MSIFLVERFYDQVREVEHLRTCEDRLQFESRLAAIQFMVERAEKSLTESEKETKRIRATLAKLKKLLAAENSGTQGAGEKEER